MINYRTLLREGIETLEAAGCKEARTDAERLLMDLLGESRAYLFLHGEDFAPPEEEAKYREFLRRRAQGEPVQYITGWQEFMGLQLEVSPAVLIPRPETELLVEQALKCLKTPAPDRAERLTGADGRDRAAEPEADASECAERLTGADGRDRAAEPEADASECAERLTENPRILDLCCGSGAIAAAVAAAVPAAQVTACDISGEALRVAARNAGRHGAGRRIRFLRTDMFRGAVPDDPGLRGQQFDMILCNPPYIPTEVIDTLDTAVRDHEPRAALDGGADGLSFYRILAEQAAEHLAPGGWLLMEIGFDQGEAVRGLLELAGHYVGIECLRDLAGLDRIIRCRKA